MKNRVALRIAAAMAVGLWFVAPAATVNEDFESATTGVTPANWAGDCVVSADASAYSKSTPGNPLPESAHTKILSVAGGAVRTYSEAGNRTVDMLVKAEDIEGAALPDADGDEHLKFAFDSDGCINLYCKASPSAESGAWVKISSTQYEAGTWVRVTLKFDYTRHLCQVKIDGSPCVSSYGYQSQQNMESPGSWYCLATNASALSSVDVAGCGGVDDLVNADGDSYTPSSGASTADAGGVEYTWYDKYGIAWNDSSASAAAPGSSGYTLKQAFDAGTDPYSSDKLYTTNATYVADSLVLTINGCGPTYSVEKSDAPFTDGVAGTSAGGTFTSNLVDNTTTWTGPFPTDALTYYRVRNASAVTAETVNQFAVMKITSSATSTLVSLPWDSLSANPASPTPITAANVVMTKNLSDGDYLLYYDGGYKGWVLTDGVWTPVENSTEVGTLTVDEADATQLARGQAIWVVRNTSTANPFYLYGQHHQTATAGSSVPSGGALLANPDATTGFNIAGTGKITGMTAGDEIRIPPTTSNGDAQIVKYMDGAWKARKVTTTPISSAPWGGTTSETETTWVSSSDEGGAALLTVPAGQGFMYVPAGSGATVVW